MFWFRKAARPRPVLRTRLRLESFDDRAVPTTLFGDGEPPLLVGSFAGAGSRLAVAPRIADFSAVELAPGWYQFTGRVVDSATVGGLTIDFGGVPSLEAPEATATTAPDGTFTLTIHVQTDGSDHGTVTARTTADGLPSSVAECEIQPQP